MDKFPFEWSIEAEEEYYKTIDYILENFGSASALKFIETVEFTIELIRINPQLFVKIDENIHRCVVSYQSSITYYVTDDILYISSFHAKRSDHSFYLDKD